MTMVACGKIIVERLGPRHPLGLVQFGPEICAVFLDLVPEAHAGDFVLVNSGCAFRKVDRPEYLT